MIVKNESLLCILKDTLGIYDVPYTSDPTADDVKVAIFDVSSYGAVVKQENKGYVSFVLTDGEESFQLLDDDMKLSIPVRTGQILEKIHPYLTGAVINYPEQLEIAHFSFFPTTSELLNSKTGEKTKLTEKEKDILLFLYQNRADCVRRSILLKRIWGYADDVETHTLETHIYRLRQKIEDDPVEPSILKTEEDGYILSI